MGDARHELLRRVVDEVAANGLADRSLRELAAATGTSHRMLLYHFGSREGLVAAIVGDVEADQRRLMLAAGPPSSGDPADVMREVWARVSAPDVRPLVQLFFEAVAYSARTGGAELTAPWLGDAAAVAGDLGTSPDEVGTRLGIAVVRGLMIDVLTTGDTAPATESLERFLSMWGRDVRP
jgi:AcrR family transcriptional regulator